MGHSWKEDRTKKRLATRYEEVRKVDIRDYTRETSLDNIAINRAYRVNGAHVYIDIVNLQDMLNCTNVEGETCHKRALRFLNQHYRAVHRILVESETVRVDFHNQRLHAVVTKPYGDADERARIERAVAIAQLTIDVLAETGDTDEHIPNAQVRVGIDSGMALAVNNGRRASREPLFLGSPANQAAKCAGHGVAEGIYLTHGARALLELPALSGDKDRTTPLTKDQVAACVEAAGLGVSKTRIIELWKEEQEDLPIGEFEFSRPTPPISDLDFSLLSAAKSKRFEGVSLYADIDGFTNFVDKHLDEDPQHLVRALHVLRSELDAVVHLDFAGRRIRFIGDCLQGVLLEGTSKETDTEATVSTAVQCAGALRSSFAVAIDYLNSEGSITEELGLAIGFELGPLALSRLGMKGSLVRCATGRAVLASEAEQRQCDGVQTAIGEKAYNAGTDAVRRVFASDRKVANLDYAAAVEELAASGDPVAKAVLAAHYAEAAPAVVPGLEQPIRPHSDIH
ncbi:adenylate/guanylate cyclase domain-containing protein [Stenotrophomonas sp. TWI587]|uniref:adenylate/guanylate cyclase domain-containing protein n=1 Tax=Stenotrophomonas sp. TWI587 TaxID=3136783 RepID=UPI0032080536